MVIIHGRYYVNIICWRQHHKLYAYMCVLSESQRVYGGIIGLASLIKLKLGSRESRWLYLHGLCSKL